MNLPKSGAGRVLIGAMPMPTPAERALAEAIERICAGPRAEGVQPYDARAIIAAMELAGFVIVPIVAADRWKRAIKARPR